MPVVGPDMVPNSFEETAPFTGEVNTHIYDANNDPVAKEIVRFTSRYTFQSPGNAVEQYVTRLVWLFVHKGARP